MMPLWLLVWPEIAPEDRGDQGDVPFLELLKTLGLLVGPLLLGLLIRYYRPKQSERVARWFSPGSRIKIFKLTQVHIHVSVTMILLMVIVALNLIKYVNVGIITPTEVISISIFTPVAMIIRTCS